MFVYNVCCFKRYIWFDYFFLTLLVWYAYYVYSFGLFLTQKNLKLWNAMALSLYLLLTLFLWLFPFVPTSHKIVHQMFLGGSFLFSVYIYIGSFGNFSPFSPSFAFAPPMLFPLLPSVLAPLSNTIRSFMSLKDYDLIWK